MALKLVGGLGLATHTQKQPPPLAHTPRSAWSVNRDIQLPDGRIATCPRCFSLTFPTRTHTRTHLRRASHVSVQHTHRHIYRCSQTHVIWLCPVTGMRVKLNFNVNTLFTPSATTSSSPPAAAATASICLIGIFWDVLLIMGWWE